MMSEHHPRGSAGDSPALCMVRHEWLDADGNDWSQEIWAWDGLYWCRGPDGTLTQPRRSLREAMAQRFVGELSDDDSHDIRFWDVPEELATRMLEQVQARAIQNGTLSGERAVEFVFNGRLTRWCPDGRIRPSAAA